MKLFTKLTPIAATLLLSFGSISTANAGAKLVISDDSYINVGAGIRTSFTAQEDASPNGESYSSDFALNNSRIYISGQLMEDFKFTFNTEEIWGEYGVLDAVIQYEPSKEFNVWVGRMLTPGDRIEMNGPFYSLTWNQYTVPLYPSDAGANNEAGAYGRDEGVTVWGTLGKFQYAVGAFDGYNGASNADDSLLYAGRLAYSFLGMENNPAYYTSSTYYGKAGDIFTVGLSFQTQAEAYGTVGDASTFTGVALDVLSETVLDGGSVITVEAEYKTFDCDCATGDLPLFDGDSYFITGAYMFANKVGMGLVQPYLRFTSNEPTDGESSDLSEIGVNYVIDGHNLLVNANITNGDANASGQQGPDNTTFTLGFQFQI
ncbi:porin [Colwellia echini]|uniref:Porin n=1 Tax=Colwellia echini TaxID=1982103 RepID=A0ABY3MTT1_9GAMM|nr:porin [Colwellia echini]TYK64610.1 hypothetical protein CWS31_014795 [Colwellia echini]